VGWRDLPDLLSAVPESTHFVTEALIVVSSHLFEDLFPFLLFLQPLLVPVEDLIEFSEQILFLFSRSIQKLLASLLGSPHKLLCVI